MTEHATVPHDKGLDHTIALAKEGYLYIPNRMKKLNTDIFITHVMAKKTICITGLDAVKIFYDPEKITRKKAAPNHVKKTLFGCDTVHGMEGDAHEYRRSLFLSLMTEERIAELSRTYTTYLDKSIGPWEFHEPVVIYNEIKKSLTASACLWAGVPILEEELKDKADQLMAMVFGFGNVMAVHAEGKAARKVCEEWMEKVIHDVRGGFLEVPEDCALMKVSDYTKPDGTRFDDHMAAVEMLNVIRPIVATSVYVSFAALALYKYPDYKEKLIASGEDYLYMFCEEVRRFYPYAPFVGGKVAKDFEWKNCEFKEGDTVLLDIYGTNHSPEVWTDPDTFDPSHFDKLSKDSKNLIAQGAGDMKTSHRCPGEACGRRLLMDSVNFLAKTITYDLVEDQNLSYDLSNIPTMPFSGIEIHNICRRVE